MKLELASDVLPHAPQKVWNLLLDPQVLSRLLPGVEKFEAVGPDRYEVLVKLGVGAVRGTYTGKVELTDQNPPSSYKLRGEGRGAPGWAKGEVQFDLVPEGAGTRIKAKADAQIGGAIAGVGQRMIEGVAKSMAREFFAAVERELAGQKVEVTAAGMGFRLVLRMIRDFFGWIFGRRADS